jgi:NAD-dependent dihydropyrimidine dehydrogenase PreA subunit
MGEWKSLYIYYISGTGNAKAASGWIADEASSAGLRTVVQRIDRLENISMPDPSEKPLLGFAFPTHGFNAAPIMLRFIAGFPRGLGKEVFLVNTRAGMKLYKLFMSGISGVALIVPAIILRFKGYKCIGFFPVDLPSNWIPLHPGLRKKVIESIFVRCEKIVRKFSKRILSGEKIYTGLYTLPLDLLLSPIALGYYVGGRFFLSKTFIANNKCNKCGICIRECPTASIKMVADIPYWKLTCESCMRCLNICPTKAIESAHGMAAVLLIAFSALSTRIIMLIISLFQLQPDTWWWKISENIIEIGLMVLVASVLYRVFHYSMHFRPFRYLLRFTSLTALPFWRRYNRNKMNSSQKR